MFLVNSVAVFLIILLFIQVMTPLNAIEMDPPTISMTFSVNDSPLGGRDGTQVC
jgi:predicted membrane GTPase involved in stress response